MLLRQQMTRRFCDVVVGSSGSLSFFLEIEVVVLRVTARDVVVSAVGKASVLIYPALGKVMLGTLEK